MGFLTLGDTYAWPEALEHVEYVKRHGILQFLHTFRRLRTRANDCLKWGDEVEYVLVVFDERARRVRLLLTAERHLQQLQRAELEGRDAPTLWRPEYTAYMVEGTPGHPYLGNIADLRGVEANMALRRRTVQALLGADEQIFSITNFPLLGASGVQFTEPPTTPGGANTESAYVSDEVTHEHRRFRTLTRNIRLRRGEKVDMRVPIFRDERTPADEREIHMDCMAFGMGCCCLQCTFQCCNIDEARNLYDHFGCLAPIMLAFSAATPVFRGRLADVDVRWNVIGGSVDCRNRFERGEAPLDAPDAPPGAQRIAKSRYASISCFISTDAMHKEKYNDTPVVRNEWAERTLLDEGIDAQLARHLAYYWVRDPMVIYEGQVEIDDETRVDHFENIQSTNWQTVRFKPPPPNSGIGWRVEFRPLEAQTTDFENAALCVFVVLVSRLIINFGANFYMPISKIDENMETAHRRNALLGERFWFRRNITADADDDADADDADECVLLTVAQILNGDEDVGFPGIIPLIHVFLDTVEHDAADRERIDRYLDFISRRASGEYINWATWIRRFVRAHPSYAHDSHVSEECTFDMLKAMQRISDGSQLAPDLFGDMQKHFVKCTCIDEKSSDEQANNSRDEKEKKQEHEEKKQERQEKQERVAVDGKKKE